jgi:hypothetical protein
MKTTLAVILSLLPAMALAADPKPAVDIWGSRAELSFEPNLGQTTSAVRYLAHTSSGVLHLTDSGVVFGFELAGANPAADWEALDATGRTTSYRIGRDRSQWLEAVPSYRRLIRRQIYPGIDLVYYGKGNQLEYDFRVAPHADSSRIRLQFPGARSLAIGADGSLAVEMAQATVHHRRPRMYETLPDGSQREVAGEYQIAGATEAVFRVGPHDSALELAIDPVLDSSTFLGGNGDDSVIASNGLLTVGNTDSLDFPGAPYGRLNANNIFVQMGTETFIYGATTGSVIATSAALSDPDFIIVGGYTTAKDLPVTSSLGYGEYYGDIAAWQPEFAGGATDGFLLILYQESLQYPPSEFFTYIGTPRDDRVTAVTTSGAYFAVVGSTDGRGLPSEGAPTFLGVPAGAAAGVDGFLITAYSELPFQEYYYATTYFGGSGDDTPLAVYTSPNGDYIAGETTSVDFPVANGMASSLKGLADAFVMRFPLAYEPAGPATAILYGGSGVDRGTALSVLANASVLLAGNTTSTDLPLANAAQSAYGGGASDAFLAMFPMDLSSLQYATYIGGSGADEATSVASDSVGNIFVGGWTSSLDFPLLNSVQPVYGGGASDGFLVRYDQSGRLQDSSYFGGSGRDEIRGLYAPGGSMVLVSGQTSSANLPLMNPTQSSLNGPSDGFIASISSNTISAPPVVNGKDLRVWTYFYIGNAAVAATTTVTITSSDPTTVQVAANSGDAGQASIQVQPVLIYDGAGAYGYYFPTDCLKDSGSANLTYSAPGYPSLTVQASCLPSGITTTFEQSALYQSTQSTPGPTVTLQLGTEVVLVVGVGINSPTAVNVVELDGLRPGATPITVQIANSNPAVATISQSSVTLAPPTSTSGTNVQVGITVAAPGQTQFAFTAPGSSFLNSNPVEIVVNTFTLLLPAAGFFVVPSGFEEQIGYDYAPASSTQVLTVTSQDPTRLLLSSNSSQPGSASISLTTNSALIVQAVGATGDVGLTFTQAGQAPVTATVHITTPTVVFPTGTVQAQPVALGVGQTVTVNAGFGGADPTPTCCYTPNPGNNAVLSIAASNSQVVSTKLNGTSFQVTGTQAGNTVLSIQPPSGIPLAAASTNLAVKVTNKPLFLSSVEVGNNLQTAMVLKFPDPLRAASTAQITTSDPTLVQVSTSQGAAGQAQITASLQAGSTSYEFFVYGLAASGQVQITATVPGTGTAAGTVSLDPSGFGWSAATFTAALYEPSYEMGVPVVEAFALDRTTSLPIAVQSLRPGITVSVSLVDNSPSIFTLSTSTYTFGSSPVGLTTVAAGTGSAAIVEPPGYSAPAVGTLLTVTITTPTLNVSTYNLANNLQTSLSVGPLPSIDLPLTVTSSDPSRILVSTSATTVGSASVTVNQSGWNSIYLQALADNGTVTITASMPTFNAGTTSIRLYPTGVGLQASYSATTQNGQYYSTTQSPPTPLTPAIFAIYATGPSAVNGQLRAGLPAEQVSVTSSNTAVATISGSPFSLGGQSSVNFTPAGIGQTTISVVQPAGFVPVPGFSSLTLNVTAPNLTANNYVMAKDSFINTQVSLGSSVNAPAANVPVTLTSADPTRILLSPDATTAPTPSITATLIARQTYASFYVHAFSNNGTVAINISAPGYTSTTMSILLSDLTFTVYQGSPSGINATLQNGAQMLAITATLVMPATVPQGYNNYGTVVRPGVSIAVSATSSNPAIFTVNSPIVFTGGMSQSDLTYTPQSAGTATLTLGVPAGYANPGTAGQATINVVLAPVSVSAVTIGRDLEVSTPINISSTTKPANVTVSSADPTRLLISADGISAGQASVNIPWPTTGTPAVYLQSLSDSGTVNVTAGAPNYQTGSTAITLVPSAAVFGGVTSTSTQYNILSNAVLQQPYVYLTPLNPVTFQPTSYYSGQLPRPGANIAVSVTSSNPGALAVDTPTLNLAVANPANPPNFIASLQPLAAGTAIVSLGQYPTAGTPAYGAEAVYNLSAPNLILPGFSIGQDLAGPAQVTLGSAAATPTSSLAINLSSYGEIGFSTTASGPSTSPLTIAIPAGQRVSPPFYVLGTGLGVAQVNYYGNSTSYSTSGYVVPTAFVFEQASEPQPLTLTAGSTGTFTVIPEVEPPTAAALSPLSIRAGVTVSIAVISSNPAVLNVTSPRVFLNGGDHQVSVSVTAVSPGTATLTLSGLTYDFSQPQATLSVTVK